MAKTDYFVDSCTKHEAAAILGPHHYLSGISKGFRTKHNFGLFKDEGFLSQGKGMLGTCIFTGLPVPELAVGAFGLARDDQDGLFELSRLCIVPEMQGENAEKNMTSWFVAQSIKQLRAKTNVRAIISYADQSFHAGTIYAATNFTYCGLSAEKFDYVDETGRPVSRGSSKHGTKPRTRKHRFVMIFDKEIELKWGKQKWQRN